MQHILNYIKYRFYAKGRHGVHSPFVYHFVEQVLRSKRKEYFPLNHKYLNASQKVLFYNTIAYFPADTLILIPHIQPELEELIPENYSFKKFDRTSSIFSTLQQQHSFLMILPHYMLDKSDILLLQESKMNYQLLIIHPYKNLNGWRKFKNSEDISISIFYWHFGLLIKSDAFKYKQHFLLN